MDLDIIPAKLWGACGADGAGSVARTVAERRTATGGPLPVTPRAPVGDAAFVDEHLPWGVPSAPLVVSRRPYVVGFDPEKRVPLWVGYKLRAQAPRPRRLDRWLPDPLVPAPSQATGQAYLDNPYDKGTLVRRADVSEADEPTAFYFSVCAPQADRMNRSVWVRIEDVATEQARHGAEVWVMGGTAFLPQPSGEVIYPVLSGTVAVPTHWFRITVRRGADGALDVLAFLVPNTFVVENDPTPYLASVAEIEQATGLRFFTKLPTDEQRRLRSLRPRAVWPPPAE